MARILKRNPPDFAEFEREFQGTKNQNAILVVYPWRYNDPDGSGLYLKDTPEIAFPDDQTEAAVAYSQSRQRETYGDNYDPMTCWHWTVHRIGVGKDLPFDVIDIYTAKLIIDKDIEGAEEFAKGYTFRFVVESINKIREQAKKEGRI